MGITYRKLKPEEAQDFWNMMNELDNETKFMMYEPGEREAKAKSIERLKQMIENAVSGEDLLIIAESKNVIADYPLLQEIVGYISAQKGNLSRIRHTAYIVVGIREKYRSQGIGTEFFKRLNVWAEEKNVTRLELTVMCPNTIAKHLYEKNGFQIEGKKRNSMLVDGKYIDEYYMAKIFDS